MVNEYVCFLLQLGAVREIVAEFELDDSKIELNIELPVNYPLNAPSIQNEKSLVGRETKRRWVLQLTQFVVYQNGAIADAISLWARNVERHFAGAEDCTICMCTIHSRTYQLPKAKCKHCKKKFHSECIRKWFESSSQSTCPLCRSVFR
ncbi:unnamed protein product [Enterobius vermicularis]|uniref:E3 ubiquitin-protein ligase listerin n=1 Tax=Enterobius vermicularis TaxID=51028 RepID=A0A0N4UT27_ENTVE|nr:unnamed protein product [Enterobius vermicularis]